MSWGALNNRRERTSADPLPDFLTDRDVKSFNDQSESQSLEMEEVITRKSDRPYTSRSEVSRGYGVSYLGAIDIRMSKKTLFMLMVFFTITVLMAFCIGYAIGGSSNNVVPQATSGILMPVKKPIIPIREKGLQTSDPIKKPSTAEPLAAPIENIEIDTIEESKNLKTSSGSQNNNKDNNDGEAVYEEVDSSAADNDVVD